LRNSGNGRINVKKTTRNSSLQNSGRDGDSSSEVDDNMFDLQTHTHSNNTPIGDSKIAQIEDI
jgi:hypothetical protein